MMLSRRGSERLREAEGCWSRVSGETMTREQRKGKVWIEGLGYSLVAALHRMLPACLSVEESRIARREMRETDPTVQDEWESEVSHCYR